MYVVVVVRQRKSINNTGQYTNGICLLKSQQKNIFIFTKTFLQDTIGELIGKQLSSIRHTSHIGQTNAEETNNNKSLLISN